MVRADCGRGTFLSYTRSGTLSNKYLYIMVQSAHASSYEWAISTDSVFECVWMFHGSVRSHTSCLTSDIGYGGSEWGQPIPRQGLYSLSRRPSYRKISWSLEATRFDVIMIVPLCNLTTSRQRCWRGACLMSERLEKFKPESRGFETSWVFAVRRPSD